MLIKNKKMINQQKKDEDFMQQQQDYVSGQLPHKLNHRISQFEQLHLKYSYSGMSNASSNNDFMMLTTARSFNQDFIHLNFVQAEKLYETIAKTAYDLQNVMLIHKDLILYLLYLYKWNDEKLNEAYYDKYAQDYKILNENIQHHPFNKNFQGQKLNKGTCGVCLLEDIQVFSSYFCGHQYCKQCWKSHIHQNLIQNRIFFSCMQVQCQKKYPVILDFVKKIDSQLAELYRKKICVNYAIVNKSVSYCPSENCSFFCQKPLMMQQNYVECPCGVIYCFKCQKQPHEPATCDEVQKWQKLTNQDKGNELWILKYTKKCPSCKQPRQKYVGCNHVKCFCGTQFCFNCNSLWDQAHKSSSEVCVSKQKTSIILFPEPQDKNLQKQQQINDKIIYISRSMNRDMHLLKQTQQLITKQQHFSYLKQMFEDLKSQIHHSWINLKWSLITLYLRQKKSIQIELQKDSLQSIKNLMQTVEKIQKKTQIYKNKNNLCLLINIDSRQLTHLKQQLFIRQETMLKTIGVWSQAWKNLIQ